MPEKKPEMWGIKIKPTELGNILRYNIHVAKASPGTTGFFTHDKLHETIAGMKKSRLKGVSEIGYVDIFHGNESKVYRLAGLFPLGATGKTEPRYPELKAHGIAGFVREEVVKDLIKKGPRYKIKGLATNEESQAWLRKRRIDPDKMYPLEEYLAKLRQYRNRKVWGVELKRTDPWGSRPQPTGFTYKVSIAEKMPGEKGFFSHDKLHKKIGELRSSKLAHINDIGRVAILAEHEEKNLVLISFLPLEMELDNEPKYAELTGHGIGQFARIEIVKDLIDAFPNYTITSGGSLTEKVKEHLAKRSIDPNKEYSLQEYLEKLEEYEGGKNAKRS